MMSLLQRRTDDLVLVSVLEPQAFCCFHGDEWRQLALLAHLSFQNLLKVHKHDAAEMTALSYERVHLILRFFQTVETYPPFKWAS